MTVLDVKVVKVEREDVAYGRFRIIRRAAAGDRLIPHGPLGSRRESHRVWSWRTEEFLTGNAAAIAALLGAEVVKAIAPWQNRLLRSL